MTPDFIATALSMQVKFKGQQLDDACQELMRQGFPPDLVNRGRKLVQQRIDKIKKLEEPMTIADDGLKDWYVGPDDDDTFWPALQNYLIEKKGWPEDVISSIDEASTRIVSLLHAPGRQTFDTRGLVLGYVQSGKTANFTAVIAKAVDAGYKFIIVLSGLHNSLRSQTQKRLVDELVSLNPTRWHQLTTIDDDFRASGNPTAFLADSGTQKVLCVMKKNAHRLRALRKWLSSANRRTLANCATLIIDDEADQASIDTSKTEDKPSTINGLIRDILDLLPRVGYVAYTATPFANILTDPGRENGLYPRDFIVDLPRPAGYFGAARIFGGDLVSADDDDDGLDMFREVTEEEVELLKPAKRDEREDFNPTLTTSLARALRWFWMACSVRLARGQLKKHMSMLVHTTLYTDVHQTFDELLDRERRRLLNLLKSNPDKLRAQLKPEWDDEVSSITPESMGEVPVAFELMWSHLQNALEQTQIVIDNAKSISRLSYPEGEGSIQIVVGGNTLSRGLTIEGLMVSYFVRASSMYDTLMQMGRWFGYRVGYADLPRIWMTAELLDAFQHISRVEQEIRDHISTYERENITPRDFAPRIQTHSALAVTSPLKMRYAVQQRMSFNSAVKQTTYFHHRDLDWLNGNIEAARTLLARANQLHRPETIWGSHVLYRRVPAGEVLHFLDNYRVHEEKHPDIQPTHLKGYIKDQNEEGQLTLWNVAVVGQQKPTEGLGSWDGLLPDGNAIPLINRARFAKQGAVQSSDTANIKALMSKTDRAIDLGLSSAPRQKDIPREAGDYYNWLASLRSPMDGAPRDPDRGVQMPLLLLYPIAKNSRPMRKSNARIDLDALQHIVGLGMLFPRTPRLTPQGYVTADLSRLDADREVVEHTPEDES